MQHPAPYPREETETTQQPEADVVSGTYLAPETEQRRKRWTGAGATAVGLGLLIAKAKGVLVVLLNLKWFLVGSKILLSSLSFLASVWFYALFWGWSFALVFVLLIFVHELGHAVFMRALGVPASMPYFIPGLGALITMKGRPASVLQEAYIAIAGPVVGSFASLCCFLYGTATENAFWLAAAYTGFFLNLFNLFPVLPLDGGRVAGAISPRLWMGGLVAIVVCAVAFHWFNPLLIILLLLSIPQAIAAWQGRLDPRYFSLTFGQRAVMACWYFGLAALLFIGMLAARVPVPVRGLH
ncbi:MAG: site-2 protease family protein [Candidatus Eremiobacteraeota bacterium]|nr:site-2 protease family protein [Candidatus Eremiobacteraeota bacterium]